MYFTLKHFAAILLIFVFYFSAVSCKKSTETISPTQSEVNTIVGVGNTNTVKQTIWKINAFTIGFIPQTLTVSQLAFRKSYSANGVFADSDGFSGTWSIPVQDSLVEIYTNLPNGIPITQGYHIISINASVLNLSYYINGTNVTTFYTAQ